MGNNQSSTMKQTTEVFTESVFKAMTTVQNDCITSAQITQDMVNKIDGTEFAKMCGDYNKSLAHSTPLYSTTTDDDGNETKIPILDKDGNHMISPPASAEVIALLTMPCVAENVTISNLKQEAEISVVAECKFTNEQVTKAQDQISNDLTSKANDEEDAVGAALKTIANPGGSSSDDVEINTKISNMVSKEINQEFFTKVSTNMMSVQTMKNEIFGGAINVNISDMIQKAKIQAVVGAFQENSAITEAVMAADNKSSTEAEKKVKGLTDITEQGFGTIDNAVNTVGKIVGGNMIFVIIGLCVLAFFVYKFLLANPDKIPSR